MARGGGLAVNHSSTAGIHSLKHLCTDEASQGTKGKLQNKEHNIRNEKSFEKWAYQDDVRLFALIPACFCGIPLLKTL